MTCHTYILYSKQLDKYYVGHTCNDLTERLRKHNSHHKGYTGKASDWQLAFETAFELKADAYAFERKIKSWKSRKKVEELIDSNRSTG